MNEFRPVEPDSPVARLALASYVEELLTRIPGHIDPCVASQAGAGDFVGHRGVFLVSGPDEAPTSCGGVRVIAAGRGEVKRMWVSSTSRGQGLATRLLRALEDAARELGCDELVLDTNSALTQAVRLYERNGFARIDDYNGNSDADRWFGKSLVESPGPEDTTDR